MAHHRHPYGKVHLSLGSHRLSCDSPRPQCRSDHLSHRRRRHPSVRDFPVEKNKWTHLSSRNNLLSDWITSSAVLEGKCYITTRRGISVLQQDGTINNNLNEHLKIDSTEIKAIAVQDKARFPTPVMEASLIWIYAGQRLGYFSHRNSKKPKITWFDQEIPFRTTTHDIHLLPDYISGVYVSSLTESFYFNYKNRRLTRLTVLSGLISEGSTGMTIDFEKNIWLPCGRGVTKIAGRRFDNYRMLHGLLEDEVASVLEYDKGKFVLGHANGLTFMENGQFQKLHLNSQDKIRYSLTRVLDLKVDSRGHIWAALGASGLLRIDNQKQLHWYGYEHGLPPIITSLWLDASDNLWVGTKSGLFYRENGSDSFRSMEDTLPGPLQ